MKTKNAEYQAKWYSQNKEKRIAQVKERQIIMRERFQEYKTTLECILCGENHPACLEFHHRDPTTKDVNLSEAYTRGWGWERIMKEVEKCDVLCANCHRKEHG